MTTATPNGQPDACPYEEQPRAFFAQTRERLYGPLYAPFPRLEPGRRSHPL
jgi:hypothetical protein